VIIVLLAIPLAFIGNTLRVVFFAVVLENKGVIITEGTLHTISGMVVFAFALAVLILSSKWMSRE
jgi:exosortase/archaeosortase family protein